MSSSNTIKQDNTYVFIDLSDIMDATGMRVKDLAQLSEVSTASIGRARRGMAMKKVTLMKLFHALTEHKNCSISASDLPRLIVPSE